MKKNIIKNIIKYTCIFIPITSWRKNSRNYLNAFEFKNFFFKTFIRRKEAKCNFLIIDDFFPLPHANTWRSVEFHEYLKKIPDTKILNIPSAFSNQFVTGMLGSTFQARLKSYIKYKPENQNSISQIDETRFKYKANLAYVLFFNNTCLMLPWLEKNKMPFVFCLYPGGGFCPDIEEKDKELRKILSSPMFKKVIVTQNYTKEYLIKKEMCSVKDIEFIYGGFSQIENQNYVLKKRYQKEKQTFDICFVAYKYTEKGIKKGLDLFMKVAKRLSEKHDDIHFHIVGNWDSNMQQYLKNKNIHFYGIQPAEFFPEFYSKMDINLNCNRGMKQLRKEFPKIYKKDTPLEFDGFPLGLDSAISNVGLFITDEMEHTKGFFEDEKNIFIIDANADNIIDKIEKFYHNAEKLYEVAEVQKKEDARMFQYRNTN